MDKKDIDLDLDEDLEALLKQEYYEVAHNKLLALLIQELRELRKSVYDLCTVIENT